jgi:glycosyltransferase involved in cell wall biosynthesis
VKAGNRPSLLAVLSSSCQLYSGTGKALFDWIRVAHKAMDVSLLIDSNSILNFDIAHAFCRDMGLRLYPSEGTVASGCPDVAPRNAPHILRSKAWDFVECLSWANAATNLEVINNLPAYTRLLFTPHTQPMWTLPSPEQFFMVPPVLDTMFGLCDLVFMDTPNELAQISSATLPMENRSFIPLGVDTGRIAKPSDPRTRHATRLLSVFDFREQRKRPDLLMAAFAAIIAVDPSYVLVIAGNGSQDYPIPASLESNVVRMGYISDKALIRQYQTCGIFLLLSDFEAFGLPIAEALCCGTSVIITQQDQTTTVFGDLHGVSLVDNADAFAVRDAVLATTQASYDPVHVAQNAIARFSIENTYARKLSQVMALPCLPRRSQSYDHGF